MRTERKKVPHLIFFSFVCKFHYLVFLMAPENSISFILLRGEKNRNKKTVYCLPKFLSGSKFFFSLSSSPSPLMTKKSK